MKVGDRVSLKVQKPHAPVVEGCVIYVAPGGRAVDVEYFGTTGKRIVVRRGVDRVTFIAEGPPATQSAKVVAMKRESVSKFATGGRQNPSLQRPPWSETVAGTKVSVELLDVPCPLCGARRHAPCRDTKVFHNDRHVSRDGAIATITIAKERRAAGEISHADFCDEIIAAVGIGHPVVERISMRISDAKAARLRQDAERRARLRRLREESAALGGHRDPGER